MVMKKKVKKTKPSKQTKKKKAVTKETKKNKRTKAEATKKKIHTKPNNKEDKVLKENRRKKKETIDSMEHLFRLINSVQIEKKEASLVIEDVSLRPIIVNILKDANLSYKELVFGRKILIRILAPELDYNEDFNLEDIDKEFIFDITSL